LKCHIKLYVLAVWERHDNARKGCRLFVTGQKKSSGTLPSNEMATNSLYHWMEFTVQKGMCRKLATLETNTKGAAHSGTVQCISLLQVPSGCIQKIEYRKIHAFLEIMPRRILLQASLFWCVSCSEVHGACFLYCDAIFDGHCADKVDKASGVAPFIVIP